MTPDCKYFESCAAPICPLLNEDIGTWFPDEELCKLQSTDYTKTQRKIARKVRDTDRCFNVRMLRHKFTITSALKGLDPDRPFPPQEEAWFRDHPALKPKTEEQKAASRERMKELHRSPKKGRTQGDFEGKSV